MDYLINKDSKRVILNILAKADKSLIGLTLHNCSVISMSIKDLYDLVVQIHGVVEYNYLFSCLTEHGVYQEGEERIIVLETVEEDGDSGIYEYDFCNALRLFKAEDVFSCYRISYRWDGKKVVHGGIIRSIKYIHAIDHLPARYCMTEKEKTEFPKWYDNCFQKLKFKNIPPKFRSVLQMYYTSYTIGIIELEYIMLFSVLEMIFGSGHSEITYQISRGTALILSEDSKTMIDVNKRMKKLYAIRSKYVHAGETVPLGSLYELRDIVRRVLIRLTELPFYTLENAFEILRERILIGGFQCYDKDGDD